MTSRWTPGPAQPLAMADPEKRDIVDKSNLRLLVIDDNATIHDDFRKILSPTPGMSKELDEAEAFLFGMPAPNVPITTFEITSAFQGQEGLLKVVESLADEKPFAVCFVDIRMPPGWDGIETIEHLWDTDPRLQVVICTAHSDYSSQDIVRRLGETDRLMIIKKPFDQEEVRLAATALCEKWTLARKAEWKQRELEEQVALQTTQIVQTRDLTVFALARLAESRDPETGEHLVRMRAYSQILAEQLARTGPFRDQIGHQFLDDLYRSSPLHDIGKVGIPDSVLLKPGRLTPDEFEVMKTHTTLGAETLADAASQTSAGSFLEMAIDIARFHHERYDGAGYPQGLSGEQIPLAARIVAVADVFDALTSKRVYKQAMEPDIAREMIVEQRGKQFEPAVVDAFIAGYGELVNVLCESSESRPSVCRRQIPFVAPALSNPPPVPSGTLKR